MSFEIEPCKEMKWQDSNEIKKESGICVKCFGQFYVMSSYLLWIYNHFSSGVLKKGHFQSENDHSLRGRRRKSMDLLANPSRFVAVVSKFQSIASLRDCAASPPVSLSSSLIPAVATIGIIAAFLRRIMGRDYQPRGTRTAFFTNLIVSKYPET